MDIIRRLTCDWCKKEFETEKRGKIWYCGEACRGKARRARDRDYQKQAYQGTHAAWELQRENKAVEERARIARRKNQQELVNIAVEAKALGMSYGKYVAMLEMNARI